MKKTIATLSMLLAGLFAQYDAQAQYVTLPDTNFRNYMRTQCSTCFNAAGDLDTLAAESVIIPNGLNFYYNCIYSNTGISSFIKDITGIHYFKKIQSLDVDFSKFDSLPKLPYNLNALSFRKVQFEFPAPTINVPDSVRILVLDSCNLSTLPTLPNKLQSISLSNNPNLNFSSLPPLPNNNFIGIDLSYNNLSEFPSNFLGQQSMGLQSLNLSNNQLTTLPASFFMFVYPIYLDVSNNQLTDLYASAENLNCSNNPNLTCLTRPIGAYSSINISGTAITCLPNKPLNYSGPDLPVCSPTNNLNSCPNYPYVVTGKIYKDLNNNGIYDSNEPLVKKSSIGINSYNYDYNYSQHEGQYKYELAIPEQCQLSLTQIPVYWEATEPSTTIDLYNYQQAITQDWALVPLQTAKDVSAAMTNVTPARPGFGLSLQLDYENVGTVSANAVAKFVKPAFYTVDSASVSGYMVSGDTLIWNFGTLSIGQIKHVTVYGKVSTAAALGSVLSFQSFINNTDASDNNLADNSKTLTLTVVGSFDPNDKQARATISPSQIAAGEYIDYTIRFQNTGTDTAFNVVIADTLTNTLQANTLEVMASSHNVRTSVKNNVVYFEHLNIQLPDSNINEKASHGFVSFRIKPQTNLALGSTVSNKAAIYFDYNAPVITNTAVTKVQNPTGIFDKINKTLATYPNPVDKGVLYIPNMVGASATLTSLEGKELRNWSAIGESVSLEGIAQGMYLLKVTQKGESRTAKVMVK